MPKLIFILEEANVEFPIRRNTVVLGRDRRCDITIENDWISQIHAELKVSHDGVVEIVDANSRNGTQINGVKITRRELQHGDRLSFGQVRALFWREEAERADRVKIHIGPPLRAARSADAVRPASLQRTSVLCS